MSKLLVVFGATGNQGGSVVEYVINDPELSKEYKVRAITRDVNKPAAQDLQKKGVEVVAADQDDKESLKSAYVSLVFLSQNVSLQNSSKSPFCDIQSSRKTNNNIADEEMYANAHFTI